MTSRLRQICRSHAAFVVAVVHCHPEFGVESTLKLIPYLKEQHKPMWVKENLPRKLRTVVDYRKLWNMLEADAAQ